MDILSAAAFEEEMERPFWKELQANMKSWIPDLQKILEDPNHNVTDKEADRARGSLEAVRNALNAPQIMLETKIAREKQGETDES